MQSSTGKHYIGLDHIRALAALTVFSWHFLHINGGSRIPLEGTFTFPLNSLFAEGHTGVGIFMVLSGYLFAKITDGKRILYFPFLYNRAMRLAPLLIAVMAVDLLLIVLTDPSAAFGFLKRVAAGFVLPRWTHGGWSIAIEGHFYLIFPLIMLAESIRRYSSLVFLALGLSIRLWIYLNYGGDRLQDAAYWTILGRIDQFVLGILFFRYCNFVAGRHLIGLGAIAAWLLLWQQFDRMGGFYENDSKIVWAFLTTAEGLFYGVIIAWYDKSFAFSKTGLSGFVGKIGEWSYSIYLLHFFVVYKMANFINAHIVKLDNFYLAMLFAIPCFALVAGAGFLSYTYFEKRFLAKRIVYVRDPVPARGLTAPLGGRSSS